ncbi:MAG: hypothetical protein IPM57_07555 [Oligoflexia bacterium]|nr:hypothetical protein [Oligoflexia bacterium]
MRNTIQPFLFVLAFVLTTFLSNQVLARTTQQKRFVGFPESNRGWTFLLGEPIYARYSLFTNWKRAWNFSLGYSFSKLVVGSVDHVWYFYSVDDKVRELDFWNSLLFYLGVGAKAGMGLGGHDPNDNPQLGIRLVSGAEYVFVGSPWSVRLELTPEINLKGRAAFNIAAGVGLTYYIGSVASEIKKKTIKYQDYDPSEFD